MILIPKYNNVVELGGSLSLVLTDTTTNTIKQELYVPNAIVFTGKIFIASRMIGTSSAVMSHMGIGTGTAAVDSGTTVLLPGNSALTTELTTVGGYTGYARAAVTSTNNITVSSTVYPSNQVTYSANFAAQIPSAPAGGAALTEAGIFNASTAGTMLCRTVFPVVTKLPADALTITWTITIQ
jgi:hypothetical protein